MRRNESDATRRRVPVSLSNTDGAPYTGTLTGGNVPVISLNVPGTTVYALTADQTLHVLTGGRTGRYYVQLAQAETLVAGLPSLTVDVAGADLGGTDATFEIDEIENNQTTILGNQTALLTALGVDTAAVQAAILTEAAIDEAAIIAAVGGSGAGLAAAILGAIFEGPSQVGGGGEALPPGGDPAVYNVTVAQGLREILAYVSNDAVNLNGGGPTVLRSRGKTRNRVVATLANGNRSITSRDNS